MKGIKLAILTFGIPLLVLGASNLNPAGSLSLRGQKGMTSSSVASSTDSLAIVSTLMSQTYSSQSSTATQIIAISSSAISSLVSETPSTITSASVHTSSSIVISSSSSSTSTTNAASHRNLVIVLAAVFGSLGLLLVAGSIFISVRCCGGKTPFSPRGASPIDDEEIESWRQSGQEKRSLSYPPQHVPAIREVGEISPGHNTDWTWATTASSGSTHTVPNPFPDSPSFYAMAPNARAGLTDQAIPGEDPFVACPKRNSSRISKLPPSHARTWSRRSSISAKSLWSAYHAAGHSRVSSDVKLRDKSATWNDPYDERSRGTHWKAVDDGSDTRYVERPRYNDAYLKEMDMEPSAFGDFTSVGLWPRPKSVARTWERTDDIGRAIA